MRGTRSYIPADECRVEHFMKQKLGGSIGVPEMVVEGAGARAPCAFDAWGARIIEIMQDG